ncbi:hypothetical protein TTHERM_002653408 (macronuclear) [Tetrahymena thermophila SB210]|uniref:Uncharacterized protein n=1 Tax=Tetrahymena thermophila (strain SB210) TaxID=312017 RepID=W7X1A5_TETTS|nr:hypothetical protein TTHERM_002653408 [Tetrahymena thermophila SB210]EWS71352.1 hypothetical protein TTHERM_002653408 [Tetrahymena thermophila SB210]|eukprot:XP_012656112.1 hypothetical protein TTHERM_002653408 [Tetrahymena thermophila SB210]
MNQKTKRKIELAYRIISDLVDLVLTIVCFVKLLDSYSSCNKFYEYSYIGDQCSVKDSCSYYAINKLTDQQLQDDNCYVNYQHGYLKMDIPSGDRVVYSIIAVLLFRQFYLVYCKLWQLCNVHSQLYFDLCLNVSF